MLDVRGHSERTQHNDVCVRWNQFHPNSFCLFIIHYHIFLLVERCVTSAAERASLRNPRVGHYIQGNFWTNVFKFRLQMCVGSVCEFRLIWNEMLWGPCNVSASKADSKVYWDVRVCVLTHWWQLHLISQGVQVDELLSCYLQRVTQRNAPCSERVSEKQT